jgi:hypothetical protein
VLPVLQEALEADGLNENEPPPETFEAKVETFFFTWSLPQDGQITLFAEVLLRTSSSNGFPQLLQVNSNKGIYRLLRGICSLP